MKASIKLTALFLLASTGLFAAAPAKTTDPTNPAAKEVITFSSLPSLRGVDIKVEGREPAKAIVMIYDQDHNVIYKDALPAYKKMEKGYILNQLEYGDYTIEVTAGKQVVTKDIHVYDENRRRVFLVKQS
jgi:hypothetical protein